MKILLLGDASNCHRSLAEGLRKLGHTVCVASAGSGWMHTERDINLNRPLRGKAGGLLLYLKLRMLTAPGGLLTGYDVVSIHNPIFADLMPHRVREIFDRIRRGNRSVFLTALGDDTPYVETCTDPALPLRYSEYRIGTDKAPYALNHPEIEKAWLNDPLRSHCNYIYNNIDGAVAVLYEYWLALQRVLPPEKTAYGGIAIDTETITPDYSVYNRSDSKVKIMLARHSYRQDVKGTDLLEAAARKAIEMNPGKGELVIVEDLPYAEYLKTLHQAHVVVDQAYSYTPATNALLTMANGRCTVSGGEPEYYRFIHEDENRPIFNSPVTLAEMTDMFSHIINSGLPALKQWAMQSREFVEKHNNDVAVATRFVNFWQKRLNQKET